MNRRKFLVCGLAAAGGAIIAPGTISAQTAGGGRKVVIIGAGLSGLAAGYELSKQGYDVHLLEGQKRIGGRVLTVREFSESLYAEAGAARIPADHDLTHRYIREFGLQLVPFYPTEGKFMRRWGNKVDAVGWDKFEDATSMVMSLNKPAHWQKIDGGNDRLPRAFAAKLAGKISDGTKAVRIRHDQNKAIVTYQDRSGSGNISADLVICAVPFTMLRKVEFDPPLSSARAEAIRNMEYDSASRVLIETKRRFWRDKDLNGFGFGEDAAEIWESTLGQPGTHGIMQSYVRGGFSVALTRLPELDRITTTVDKLSRLFPELRDNFVKGITKCWNEDPWVEGAWAHPDARTTAAFKAQEGRIFFAGEHLSAHASWMQGALESGLAVANQVLAMPARSTGAY